MFYSSRACPSLPASLSSAEEVDHVSVHTKSTMKLWGVGTHHDLHCIILGGEAKSEQLA